MPVRIALATSNPHKVRELRAIFDRSGLEGVELIGLGDLGISLHEPPETGRTFEENAAIKARSYAAQTGLLCLADDSGLEIDALKGAPGVISSHYCTDGREAGVSREERDRLNIDRVLKELAGVPPERRGSRFVCVMTLASPDELIASTRGTFEGRIGLPGGAATSGVPRGEFGFGYDPIFLVAPDFGRTSAELPPEEKDRLSHRGHAAGKMAVFLQRFSAGLSRCRSRPSP